MRGPGYPAGVPNPFVAHVHPYPTRFHGAIWTRPQFAFPQMQAPQSVFIPGRDIEMIPDKPYTGSGMNGLGDLQYNVGDGIFKPGGYGGGVFDGNLSGAPALGKRAKTSMGTLGDAASDAVDYPWDTYSAKTAALQTATNTELKAAGYCPIAVDGKLGPATCGARDRLNIDAGTGTEIDNPSTCQAYTTPTSASTGCGSKVNTVVSTTAASRASMTSSAPMASSTKKILGFVAGGLAAVAVVYYVKKKRR
jgi:hypothetical protein